MTAAVPAGARPARGPGDELPACADVWRAGLDGYGPRVGRLPMIAAPGPLVTLLAHLRGTDPERFLVAVRPEADGAERVVAFASAIRRDHVWFLGMLFVHPDEQARGLGRALLEAVLPAGDDPATLATCTDAAQPISNALVRPVRDRAPRAGPRARGPARPGAPGGAARAASGPSPSSSSRPARPTGPGRAGWPRRSTRWTGASLGYAHPRGSRLPRGEPGGWATSTRPATGGSSATGTPRRSGASARWPWRTRRSCPGSSGTSSAPSSPPGPSRRGCPARPARAVTALLEAGLRLEDFPALLCWDRPFADFSRYVPITLAVL